MAQPTLESCNNSGARAMNYRVGERATRLGILLMSACFSVTICSNPLEAGTFGLSIGPAWYDGNLGVAGHVDYRSSEARSAFWQADVGVASSRKFGTTVNEFIGVASGGVRARLGPFRSSAGVGVGVNREGSSSLGVLVGLTELRRELRSGSSVGIGYRYEVLFGLTFSTPKHRLFATWRLPPLK
jgi:hypothetical protein